MADGTRLTWHAGSVLPYASLWHTVQRVCALNCLRSRELPNAAGRALGSRFLLDNRGNSVDVALLAKWIGETPEVFRWSHLGALPGWVRAVLVTPNPRVCLSCLAVGYHAALFSVRLLDVCPIHGCVGAAHRYSGQARHRRIGYWEVHSRCTCQGYPAGHDGSSERNPCA
jgi:hypothetical protein